MYYIKMTKKMKGGTAKNLLAKHTNFFGRANGIFRQKCHCQKFIKIN